MLATLQAAGITQNSKSHRRLCHAAKRMQNHVLKYTDFNFTEGCILSAAVTRAREAVAGGGLTGSHAQEQWRAQGAVRLSSLHARLATAADRLNLPRSLHLLSLPVTNLDWQ